VPVGTVTCYAGATAPNPNYLLCQGQAISRTTYSALFAAIGTTYGTGDGSSTFNIPDLRGRTAIGSGTGSGLSARTLGAAHGTETHPLVTGEMPFHNHTITHPNVVATADGVHLHSPSGGVTNFVTADSNPGASIATVAGPGTVSQNSTTTSNGSHTHAINGVTDFAGAGTGHNNMQPSRVLNYIIKVL